MSNDYYNHGTYPIYGTQSSPVLDGAEWDKVTTGFAKLPTLVNIFGGKANYAGLDTGAANAYIATVSSNINALADGIEVVFKVATANTGASTLNVNSLGLTAIVRPDGSALVANDMIVGQFARVRYSATLSSWVLELNIISALAAAAASAAAAAASAASAASSVATAAASAASASASAAAATSSSGAAAASAAAAAVSASTIIVPDFILFAQGVI